MSERYSTAPVGGSLPAPAAQRHDAGAVLRDVAVQHEPRVLPAHPGRAGGRSTPQPPRVGDVLPERAAAAPLLGAEVGAYQTGAGEAAAYQRGHEAGQAEAEAAQRERHEENLRQGWQAGFDQGIEEGRERGLVEGREAGRAESAARARDSQAAAEERLARLDVLAASMEGELARRLAGAEEELLALCHAVVCRILGEQLVTRAGVAHCVAQAVREAGGREISDAGGKEALAVHVHPRDLELLGSSGVPGDELPAPAVLAGAVRWVADERVRLGGCLVRSAEGTLDARLETQLEALHALLRGARPAAGPEAPAPPTPAAGGGSR